MTAPLTIVNTTARSTLLYGSQGSAAAPIQVINLDSVNTVWVGNVSNIAPGINSIPLTPGSSTAFDGSVSVYAVTAGPSVAVAVNPGGVSYSPGGLQIIGNVNATISGNVNIANTPDVTIAGQLTSLDVSAATVVINPAAGFILPGQTAQLLLDGSAHTMIPGAAFFYPKIAVGTYTSLNVTCNGTSPGQATAGGALVLPLTFAWYDDVGITEQVFVEQVCIYLDPTVGTVLQAAIPVHGAYLVISAQNIGTLGNATVANMVVTGSYRAYPYPSYRQVPGNNFACNGVTVAGFNHPLMGASFSGHLASLSNFTPGTGTKLYPIPLYAGPAWLQYSISTAILNNVPTIVDLSFANSGGVAAGTAQAGVIWSGPNVLNSLFQEIIELPRSPCGLVINPAATSTVQFDIIGQQGY